MAKFVLPGQGESGDQHLVCCNQSGILIAAIDGIGHGEEAANAAKAAVAVLKAGSEEPVISLLERCHEELRATRGVVLSLASIEPEHGMMTWAGVGNVQGALMRNGAKKGNVQEVLLLRGGVVGSQLPALQAAVLPVAKGIHWYLLRMGFEVILPKVFPRWNLRKGRRTRSSNSIAAEMTTRWYWWRG